MHLILLDELLSRLPRQARLLGLDFGTKTIGLALSDVERSIATPLETIARTKFAADASRLQMVIQKFDIAALIMGLPLNMDGTAGPRVQATYAFMRNFGTLCPLPFCTWDERLSTAAVTRSLIDQNVSRATRARVVDKMAAAYILQGALDRLSALTKKAPGAGAF